MAEPGANTFIAHLEALRGALLRSIIAVAVLFPAGYFLAPKIITALVAHSIPAGIGALHYFTPMEVFLVELKFALVIALVLAYPWVAWQIWRFILPALYPNERRALRLGIFSASVLFFGGVLFCAWLILPLLMNFSSSFGSLQIQPMIGLSNFLELAGWLCLAFGAMFQTPLVVLIAVRLGFVSCASLREKRPYVIVVILILAAILTPPDVMSQLLLAVPTWLLFEIGLFIAARVEKK
jgi:sec-independent protein translocase protein TatC